MLLNLWNAPETNITPCKMDGTPIESWVPTREREIEDKGVAKNVNRLLTKKYGLMKKIFGMQAARQGRIDTILEIKLVE